MNCMTLLAVLTLLMGPFSQAQADNRLDGLKKMNAEGCVGAIALEKNPPKDGKQVKPYCTCVYDMYYDGFTPVEQEQLFSGAPVPEKLKQSLMPRLQAAKAQCRKKIGF